jgi:hypothetical protein
MVGSESACERLRVAIQHTSYVRSVREMGRTVDIVFVGYDSATHTYFCRTNSKYCPWREETDYKVLDVLGKREGTAHNDNHIWIVIQRDPPKNKGGVTLRCGAQWHTRKKSETRKCYKERDITPANWACIRDTLFEISKKRNAARDLYDMCYN